MKRRFIEEPANCKLLIVVSKLLTGFDAPSCTYIYLDNEMYDHKLFQAICRTNRLDGDDKDYGHIVDYKELFKEVQDSIAVYNSDELEVQRTAEMAMCAQRLVEGREEATRRRPRGAAVSVRAGGATARDGAIPAVLLRRRQRRQRAQHYRSHCAFFLQGDCHVVPRLRGDCGESGRSGYSDS